MSFLDSVLRTISDSSAPLATPTVKSTASSAPTIARSLSKNIASHNKNQAITREEMRGSGKRKAEVEILRGNDKVARKNTAEGNLKSACGSTAKATIERKPSLTVTSSVSSSSYKGTGRPSPTIPVTTETKAPPKKGSYAEIMARKNNATASLGVITHKPKEKLSSKKELEELKKNPLSKKNLPGQTSKNATGSKSNSPAPGKPITQPPKSALPQGNPKTKPQPSYKGTMKPVSSLKPTPVKKTYESDQGPSRRKSEPTVRHREYYSDEEEEDEEEGSYDGSEDDLSDMEAGFSDVEEEDENAAKLAKKEDRYEQMMLEEMARQKAAKRKRLEALAAKAKDRKY